MIANGYELAQRFVGLAEIHGPQHNGFIQWCFSLCSLSPETPDETPWCSAFCNGIAWMMRLPRSKSAAARSWLAIGQPIPVEQAQPGNDVVILARGEGQQPGAEIIAAPGHVGFFAGLEVGRVHLLGGNQGDRVSVAPFPRARILGVRRLA